MEKFYGTSTWRATRSISVVLSGKYSCFQAYNQARKMANWIAIACWKLDSALPAPQMLGKVSFFWYRALVARSKHKASKLSVLLLLKLTRGLLCKVRSCSSVAKLGEVSVVGKCGVDRRSMDISC